MELENPTQKSEQARAAKADEDGIIDDGLKNKNDEGEGY